jgi:hypothetical protein
MLNEPPRPLLRRWLRGIFLYVASTPPFQGGELARLGFAKRGLKPTTRYSISEHVFATEPEALAFAAECDVDADKYAPAELHARPETAGCGKVFECEVRDT